MEGALGGQVNSGPMSYAINGRQYVSIAAWHTRCLHLRLRRRETEGQMIRRVWRLHSATPLNARVFGRQTTADRRGSSRVAETRRSAVQGWRKRLRHWRWRVPAAGRTPTVKNQMRPTARRARGRWEGTLWWSRPRTSLPTATSWGRGASARRGALHTRRAD